MRKLLALAVVAAALAGCGNDSCTTDSLPVSRTTGQCSSLAAGSQAAINVQVCPKCTDTSVTCQAEVVAGEIQIDPVAQVCQGNLGCDLSGCATQAVPCTVSAPLVSGQTYTIKYLTDAGLTTTTIVAGGGSTSCTL
jgi:phage gp45-like